MKFRAKPILKKLKNDENAFGSPFVSYEIVLKNLIRGKKSSFCTLIGISSAVQNWSFLSLNRSQKIANRLRR